LADEITQAEDTVLEESSSFSPTDELETLPLQLETESAPLVAALENYYQNPTIQFHIPGHTRGNGMLPKFKKLINNKAAYLDTTDEFDKLGTLHPETGPISHAQTLAAEAFGAKKSFFLLNGSSIGNIALALTSAKPGKKVIIGRNSHRSIVTGLILTGADPVWISPQKLEDWSVWGAVSPEEIEKLLIENPDVSLVWITNPTYEGVVSDIAGISKICKNFNVTLFVDEAHGCLWNFDKRFPVSALQLGADAVVHSMHKTGGSFSQSSILHISHSSGIDIAEVEANLKLLHTTSPSILLLASIDAARAFLISSKGQKLINNAINNSYYLRSELSNYQQVKILSANENITIDPTKIYIMIDGLSGKRLENILEVEYRIEVESATDNGILILSNIGNNKKEVEYLCECIKSIVKSNYSDISYLEKTKYMPFLHPIIKMTPREAFYKKKENISPKMSVGRVSADLIAECPPGIFVLVPGEVVTDEHLPYLTGYNSINVIVEG
jgi:arginine/lysine/ornithine decarboxylase